MNFKDFYTKTENRLTDAILSLWATGDKEMQDYFRFLLSQEPIMADVVFQDTFPWEQDKLIFEETTSIFKQKFIEALDKVNNEEFRFPKDRKPYKHQLKSWKALLNQKKSIAVTTGTGSGKTECFMLPVIQDIYENSKNKEGINAIFLYPLNALIASQRKRMHAWCSALDGINYALLTGDTPNNGKSNQEKQRAFPELITREQIRKKPPQILFTNPTMLEYMLVRNVDVPILEKSQGKLRWILLDEAHTLTGSKAAEMALLIKRVITAFDVDIKDIRFAITSATVGNDDQETLKNFMSNLCDIPKSQIEIISGKRVKNQVQEEQIPNINSELSLKNIKSLREKFLKSDALSLSEIGKQLKISDKLGQLEAIDKIADQKIDDKNLLPVRGHFFTRGIGGVYVCTNRNCDKHKGKKPNKALGTMFTIAGKKCTCGHPLLELVACRSCGNMMLEGEKKRDRSGGHFVFQKTSVGYEAFSLDEENDDEESGNNNSENSDLVRLIKNNDTQQLVNQNLYPVEISKDNKIISTGNDFLCTEEDSCPHCGNQNRVPIHFRISSAFTNRILSDIILDQTEKIKNPTTKTLYQGKKYISFTDSRQGTAKISALINFDSERDWIRYQVYHYLIKKLKQNQTNRTTGELLEERAYYIKQLEDAPPFLKQEIKDKLNAVEDNIENNSGNFDLTQCRTSWKEIIDHIKEKNDFKTLFKKAARGSDLVTQNDSYAKSLLYDQFARRIPRERSLENLGLVNLIYPSIDSIALPDIAKKLDINENEWQSLLKIAADYIIRYEFHFSFDDSMRLFTSKFYRSELIRPSSSQIVNAKKWSLFNSNSVRQPRFILLLCAGLGWHNKEDIDEKREDLINEFLEKIWRILTQKILSPDGDGFKLKFIEKTQFEIAGKEYLCPVTSRLLDQTFRGYSPWIKGNLDSNNIQNYKIDSKKNFQFPMFEYPYHRENNEPIKEDEISQWLNKNSLEARNKGLWNDLHERVFDYDKLYLAGEHSAQQNKKRLTNLEEQFENGEVNILSCSTTMEMGVDIGGVSAVVMSNVPPMPANYLQRTGRAGRRSENKSLALTFCAPNPIGLRTMNNPKWALEHKIASPSVSFDSKNIIERHINSLLFGMFIRSGDNEKRGQKINDNVEKFFFEGTPTIGENYLNWLNDLKDSDVNKEVQYLIHNTVLSKTSTVQLILKAVDNFYKLIVKARDQRQGFNKKLDELAEEFGDNSSAYKAVKFRKNQFLHKNLLNYLAEENFLPNAGLPTGIVDFEKTTIKDIGRNNSNFNSNPSYPITRALTEFSPGNNILIDGLNYKSSGIILKNNWGQSSERNVIQGCKSCGYQRIVDLNDKINDNCPECKSSDSLKGLRLEENGNSYTELVEPAGFAIDLFQTPTRAISERSKPQYLEPLLLNVESWSNHQNHLIDFRSNTEETDSEILFYNTGEGKGYSLCLDCGRVETSEHKLEGHRRLRGGKSINGESKCAARNTRDNIILGSRFKTDFTEIRLKNKDQSFVNNKKLSYSIGVILTKSLAEYLAINESELGFGIKRYNDYQTIFIYDTAKGGAGYSSQFNLYIEKILKLALDVLKNCNCETACTKCLIDRSTQWHIEDLDRSLAIEWLDSALNKKLPKEFESTKYKIGYTYGTIIDDLKRQNYHYGISEINVHVNHEVSKWDSEEIKWIDKLVRDNVKINLVIENEILTINNQDKLTIYILDKKLKLKAGKGDHIESYKIHLSAKLQNGKNLSYISNSDYDNLGEGWNKSSMIEFYKVQNHEFKSYDAFKLPEFDSNKLFESRIKKIPYGTTSNDLAKLLIDNLNNADDFLTKVKGQKFKVSYFDKYNQSEFSLRLMLQFVNQMQSLCNFEVTSLNVHLDESDFNKNNRFPHYIIHNYKYLNDYEDDLNELSNNYGFEIELKRDKRLPHYRFFSFESEQIKFNVRIDGGISHGFKPKEFLHPEDMKYQNQIFRIIKDVNYDIIYNISIE